MKKALFVLLALILIAGVIFASGKREEEINKREDTSEGPVMGGTLDIALIQEANSLLWTGFIAPEDVIQTLPFYEGLLRLDKNGVPQPFLCESFTPDADALTYTIVLKDGIKFQDGSDLDAEACAWSLQMYKDVGRKSSAFYSKVKSFEIVDDSTVVIHMSKWDSTIPQALAREPGYMFSKVAWETYGEEYCKEHPVGTGPFMLTEWNRDQNKTYEKNVDYWQGEPLLDKVVIHVYADSLVAQAALEAGDIDVFFCVDYTLARAMEEKGFRVATGSIQTKIPLFLFNSVNPDDPLHDVNVRKALCHAIDQQALCDAIYSGYAIPTNQFSQPGSKYYSPDVVGYDYNVQKAKDMLAAAGYPNGFDTRLQAKNEPTIIAAVTAIQAQLAKAGVRVKLDIVDAADYGVALTGWDYGLFYHPSSIPVDVVQQSSSMWIQGLSGICLGLTSVIRPDDLNDKILAAQSAKTAEESYKLMQEAQVMYIDKYCMFWPIGVAYDVYIIGPSVHDDGINDTHYTQATLWSAWVDE